MPFDFSNVKSLTIPVNGVQKEVKQITDGNGVIIWKKQSDVVVTYTINTGVASITIKGNDNVTYVNSATTSGSVNIPKGITITCSATVQTGYNAISNTTQVLDSDYTYSPTTSLKLFTVTLNSVYGHWENSSGTTVTNIQNVPYGTAISSNSTYRTVTITGFGTYTFKVNTDTDQYHYAFNRIDWDGASTKVTADKNVYGRATRTVRQYVVWFTNTGNYTVTFYVNGTGYSVAPNATGGSNGVNYGTSVSVYFTGQGVTSSTQSFTLTNARYFTGGINGTDVYNWQWHHSSTPAYNGKDNSQYGFNGAYWWADAYNYGSQYNLFNHGNATHCKVVYANQEFIAPIPSNLPQSYQYNYYASTECVVGSGWMAWECIEADPDDEDWYEETRVHKGPYMSGSVGEIYYGTYTYDYIRTDYSYYWS